MPGSVEKIIKRSTSFYHPPDDNIDPAMDEEVSVIWSSEEVRRIVALLNRQDANFVTEPMLLQLRAKQDHLWLLEHALSKPKTTVRLTPGNVELFIAYASNAVTMSYLLELLDKAVPNWTESPKNRALLIQNVQTPYPLWRALNDLSNHRKALVNKGGLALLLTYATAINDMSKLLIVLEEHGLGDWVNNPKNVAFMIEQVKVPSALLSVIANHTSVTNRQKLTAPVLEDLIKTCYQQWNQYRFFGLDPHPAGIPKILQNAMTETRVC